MVVSISSTDDPLVKLQDISLFWIASKPKVGGWYLTSIFLVVFTLTYSSLMGGNEGLPIFPPPNSMELSINLGNAPFASSLKS